MKINSVKSWFSVFVFVGLNAFLAYTAYISGGSFFLKLTPLYVEDAVMYQADAIAGFDVDNDGENELLLQRHSRTYEKTNICLFEGEKIYNSTCAYADILVPLHYRFLEAYFHKQLQRYVFLFLCAEGGDLFLREVDNRQHEVSSRKLADLELGAISDLDKRVSPLGLFELDHSGKRRLLILLGSFYDRYPRGLVCYDLESGEKLWTFPCAPLIKDAFVEDLNGDGNKEIVVSTFAVSNGAVVNGMRDDECWIMVLDCHGGILWNRKIGEMYSAATIAIADITNDGQPEIVSVLEIHRPHPGVRGRVMILDAMTGRPIRERYSEYAALWLPVVRTRPDGNSNIYVGDSKGTLRMFDSELHLQEEVNVGEAALFLRESFQPSWPDLAWVLTGSALYAFDDTLNQLFRVPINSQMFLFNEYERTHLVNLSHEENKALFMGDKLYFLRWKDRTVWSVLKSSVMSGLLPIMLLWLVMNVLAYQALQDRRNLAAGVVTVDELSRLVNMFQEVAHQVKNPLSTILFTAERIKGGLKKIVDPRLREDFSQWANFLEEDVKRLEQYTQGIMRLAAIQSPKFKEVELFPMVESIVSRYQNLDDNGIEWRLDLKEPSNGYVDAELLKEALCNILDNAVEAVKSEGSITVRGYPVMSVFKGQIKELVIEVEDSGCGMDENQLKEIFDLHYTTKERGMGIGLAYAWRVVKAHGGRIDVRSRKGLGTGFAIRIPARR